MGFENVYDSNIRADSYAKLEFPGTYYLAYRDLPEIIKKHVSGSKVLDFGCGTGRSARFTKKLGFDVIGVDISKSMLQKALEADPEGNYILVENAKYDQLQSHSFHLIQSIFTFDNIPDQDSRISILKALKILLNDEGILLLLDSTPDIYKNEWVSFSTKDFPENKLAGDGDKVKIIMTDVEDQRPVEDIVWTDKNYRLIFEEAGLEMVETYKPLGKPDEPFAWKKETEIAPWIIYILKKP